MNRDQASTYLEQFKGKRIAVVGDIILDRYVWGEATRISPEAPVPILHVDRESTTLGGAANVLHNLSTLGCQPLAFGVIGNDGAGEETRELINALGISDCGLIVDEARMTIEKTRFIAGHQQIVRVDREEIKPLDDAMQADLLARFRAEIERGDLAGIILEDYAKGLLNQALAQEMVDLAKASGISVALDPHPMNELTLHGMNLLTPNRKEAFEMVGMVDVDHYKVAPLEDTRLLDVAEKLLTSSRCACLLITLGGDGMLLCEAGQKPAHFETRAQEVFDVSGAGDTVIATIAACLAAGAPLIDACNLANQAAGIVVGKLGTFAIDPQELLDSL